MPGTQEAVAQALEAEVAALVRHVQAVTPWVEADTLGLQMHQEHMQPQGLILGAIQLHRAEQSFITTITHPAALVAQGFLVAFWAAIWAELWPILITQ